MNGQIGHWERAPFWKECIDITFNHNLSRLQGELQKSRKTGAELHNLTGAMNDRHDTLSGPLVSQLFLYFQHLLIIMCVATA